MTTNNCNPLFSNLAIEILPDSLRYKANLTDNIARLLY